MKCPKCGYNVNLHCRGNMVWGWMGAYVCPVCFTIVKYRTMHLKIEKIKNWITNEVFKAITSYEKQIIIDLSWLAKKYQDEFLSFRPKYAYGYGLIVDTKAVGYVIWNYLEQHNLTIKRAEKTLTDKTMCLRQIFILPEYQRKGYGKKLLDVSMNDLKISNTVWVVESPNYKFASFLVKYGYAKKRGKKIIGKNVKFVSS